MIWLSIALLAQSNGDTLRWYDTTHIGYTAVGLTAYMNWAIIIPVDSSLNGRTLHSGRVHIWDSTVYSPGTLRVCLGTMDSPTVVLDSGLFYPTHKGFYEVFFGDTLVIHQGDLIWLWSSLARASWEYPATVDFGPALLDYGDLISLDEGRTWSDLADYGLDYNWVMELILTPEDVEEGAPEPRESLALLPALHGFIISGYIGPARIYDPAGRLILRKEIKDRTRIGPLSPGIYFVVAGGQRARVAVR